MTSNSADSTTRSRNAKRRVFAVPFFDQSMVKPATPRASSPVKRAGSGRSGSTRSTCTSDVAPPVTVDLLRVGGLGVGVFSLGSRVWGLEFGVWGLGFGVWGLGVGLGVWGLGFEIWGLGCGVPCSVFEVGGFGFRISGFEFRVSGSGRPRASGVDAGPPWRYLRGKS